MSCSHHKQFRRKRYPHLATNSKYSDTVQSDKKTFKVGTGMVKGIRMNEVNKQLCNSFEKLKSFPGATLKHLKCYIIPYLIDETPIKFL